MIHYGLDIGGTKSEWAVFDEQIQLLEKVRFPTETQNRQIFLQHIEKKIELYDHKYNVKGSLGISVAGIVPKKGAIVSANIPAIHGLDLSAVLSEQLHRRVTVDNDVNCFALSEYSGGCAHGYNQVFAITLGTGVGGALVINGQIISGKDGLAGEFGHTDITALLKKHHLPEKKCGCGLKNCLDTYGAGVGLSLIYQHLTGQKLDGKQIMEKYAQEINKAGDAQKAYHILVDILSSHLVYIINILNPEMIAFGGGFAQIPHFLSDLRQALKPKLIAPHHMPHMDLSYFQEFGPVRGAALRAQKKLEE